MFFKPPSSSKNWGDMFFYEKLQHVVDSTADFVISKCRWWLPCVAVSVVGSIFLFGGPEVPAQALSLASVVAQPHLSPISFAAPPNAHPDGEEEVEDL